MATSAATDLKEQIKKNLAEFAAQPLPCAARGLFTTLGYQSRRDERILRITNTTEFCSWLEAAHRLETLTAKERDELASSLRNLNFLFQLTDTEVQAALAPVQGNLFASDATVDGSKIESYLLFAAEVSESVHRTRTALARLVRLINKPLPMPALVLFRHGDTLTLGVINRRLHKRDASRDVLEKVTLIKEINTRKPHWAHIEILHDLALASLMRGVQVVNFVALHGAWRKALDTSELNRRFYREIADWYFWAVKEVRFPLPPTNKLSDDKNNNATNVIRLLTRLIFVWFLKEKGLIQDGLFEERDLRKILKIPPDPPFSKGGDQESSSFSKGGDKESPSRSQGGDEDSPPLAKGDLGGFHSIYYHAILQNLFFATLNAEMNRDRPGSRRFVEVEEGAINRQKNEYGVKSLFRYAKLFAIPRDEAVGLFDDIPFLNGGLFECLDKEDDTGKVIYVDGFTRNPKLRPVVPDYLFFSDFRTLDLSADYGDQKRSREKVRGLIRILQDYKFTVAENTPVEEEVALDPELLGNVFENLLASYNPETGVTARKLTGSFYTPRMIVNYMIDGALKEYLAGKLAEREIPPPPPFAKGGSLEIPFLDKGESVESPPLKKGDLGGFDAHLDALIAWNDQPNPFEDEETDLLIDAIHALKTLDPAVGTGAFPMGLLHKMVYILHKLDPDNVRWKQAQLDAANRIPDPTIRHDFISHIEAAFDPSGNQADYGRKLYLIQNCIYGVDIQPIAVQIAKLRFFISLVVDQKVNDCKKNRGVLSLPNLETRFVAANSLLGVDKPDQDTLFIRDVRAREGELKKVRARHFDARNRHEKLKCMADDKLIRKEIAELLEQDHFPHDQAVLLSDWNPYDQNQSAPFFDPEWMFGINDGFDITIGNPPYVRQEAIKEQKPLLAKEYGSFYCGTADLYTYFYKRGVDLLKTGGALSFIAPNKFMRAGYGKNIRRFLTTAAIPRMVLDFGDLPIFDATTYPSIVMVKKNPPQPPFVKGGSTDIPPLKKVGSADIPPFEKGGTGGIFLAATFTDPEQLNNFSETIDDIGFPMPVSALSPDGWSLERPDVLSLMAKLRKVGTPMGKYVNGKFYRGVLTGLNEAFVIDAETRQRLIAEDPKSEEIIKPWLRGRDIRKWRAQWAGLHVIFTRRGTDIEEFPAIKRHLEQFREDLEPKIQETDRRGRKQGPYKWFEIQDNIAYFEEFEKDKIIFPDIAQEAKFTWDESKSFLGNTAYIIPTYEKWLVGLFNSQIIWWFYLNTSSTIRGGFVRFIAQYMEQLPIPPATDDQKAAIIERVEKILAAKANAKAGFDSAQPTNRPLSGVEGDIPLLEAEIDRLVYNLYGLTDLEIALVEK